MRPKYLFSAFLVLQALVLFIAYLGYPMGAIAGEGAMVSLAAAVPMVFLEQLDAATVTALKQADIIQAH